jgi:glyoxylase-like metal-dependent hydrolase (beta-lactamase superfamily II)
MTITWKHFPAGEHGFFRAPVLLSGASDAVLIDGGFTLEDGRKLAAAIRASGKRLTTVYLTQGDPDYYFSLGPVRAAFPEARVIAAEATVAAIRANVQKKIDTWGPQLKDNGPQSLEEVVIPAPSDQHELLLEGQEIAIIDLVGRPNTRTVWVPSLRALFGGVLVFSGVHVWVADTANSEERQTWLRNLDALEALAPAVVVPGHLGEGGALDRSAIDYTRNYLLAFEQELAKAPDSAALIAAMKERYPKAGMGVALDIGAKVAKGEMKWG